MEIFCRISVTVFIHLAVIEWLGSILLCYVLAVAYGHVKPWLPMISDCQVQAPEKYVARFGVVVGATLMAVQVLLVYIADRSYSRLSKLSLVLGTVAAFCLGVVSVVSERDCNPVHSAAGAIFFVCCEANMIVLTWFSQQSAAEDCPSCSLLVRQLCTAVAGAALVAFAVMSSDRSAYSLYLAICEWIGTFCILLFNWSFADELGQLYIEEIMVNSEKKDERQPS